MANKKVNIKELPPIGGIYAVPLPDGRWGACQVLDASNNNISEKIKKNTNKKATIMAVGVALDIVSENIPTLKEVKKSKILIRDFLGWGKQPGPLVIWTTDYYLTKEPGLTFLKPFPFIGILNVSPSRKKLISTATYSAFEGFSIFIYKQWRWKHDHKAFLEEYEKEQIARDKLIEAAKNKQKQSEPKLIKTLLNQKRFKTWIGFVDKKNITAINTIITKSIQQILDLEKQTQQNCKAILKKCIIDINTLNKKYDFIFTSEAEELTEELYEIAESVGIEDAEEFIDQWRDW